MFSYHEYKVVHLAFIFFFLSGLSLSLYAETPSKIIKIMTGISTLGVLVGGMGLLARLGYSHNLDWPLWVKLKLFIWLILAIMGPIVARRITLIAKPFYWATMFLFVFAAFLAVVKPM